MKTYYPAVLKKYGYPIGTLCSFCQHSIPNLRDHGCSWSRSFQPVAGWVVTPVQRVFGKKKTTCYCVHECPQFLEEPPRPDCPEEAV